jgi:hypothetical protein
MMPHEPLRDVMHRTMHNLKFIEAQKTPHGPYEVTQLLNSFLGALAHPWEIYQSELCNRSLPTLPQSGGQISQKKGQVIVIPNLWVTSFD